MKGFPVRRVATTGSLLLECESQTRTPHTNHFAFAAIFLFSFFFIISQNIFLFSLKRKKCTYEILNSISPIPLLFNNNSLITSSYFIHSPSHLVLPTPLDLNHQTSSFLLSLSLSLSLIFVLYPKKHFTKLKAETSSSIYFTMAEKHLRELLKEDQEPFLLKHYIWERRRQLKRPSPNSPLQQQLKKKNSNFPLNKCFLTSLQNATKSPLLLSPKNSTSPLLRPSNAKTASLLLEAALRIHNKNAKPKKPKPNSALGIFGSLFKKLTNRKRETLEGVLVKVKDSDDDVVVVGSCEVGFSCSCNGRPSSAVWSESNEDKSLDLESSSSGHSFDDSVAEEIEFLNKRKHVTDSACFDDDDDHGFFCESPFRFSLQRSPGYSGRHTPDFSSPAASPCRRKTEVCPFP